MEAIFYLCIAALLTFPIVSFELIRRFRFKSKAKRNIVFYSAMSAAIWVFASVAGISTTDDIVDWIFVLWLYGAVCILLWGAIFSKQYLLKIAGGIVAIAVFSLSYLLGTVGILGLGLIIEDLKADSEIRLEDGFIFKAYHLGNAISDSRGTNVEIYRSNAFLPLIEWKIKQKQYEGLMLDKDIHAKYNTTTKVLHLYGKELSYGDTASKNWADVIPVELPE